MQIAIGRVAGSGPGQKAVEIPINKILDAIAKHPFRSAAYLSSELGPN
jgi:hypothetical protein